MSLIKLRAVFKELSDNIEKSQEKALFELQELKKDLNELQRHLSGRKKSIDVEPDDIIRSAFEFAHHYRGMLQRQEILDSLQGELAVAEAMEYLESRGAKMLQRPSGWHFQTSKERFLLHETDPIQAADALRKLLSAGKRLKKNTRKKK